MLKKKTYILLLTFHFLFVSNTFSQNIQYTQNSIVIEEFSKISKNLNDDIRIDVTGLNFNELMTVIADEHKLNIVVDPSLNQPVVGNFYDVKVKDVLTFLADKYEVEVELNNNILSFKKRIQIKTPIIEEKVKEIDIDYRSENDFLSINLKNDSLPKVAAAITNKTGRNIIIAPEAKNLLISSYIKNRPFDQVIQMMAKSNGLMVNIDDNQFYYIEKDDTPQVSKNDSKTTNNTKKSSISLNNIILRTDGFLDIRAEEVDVESLIKEAAEKSNANYFLYSDFKDFKATLAVNGISFEDLLQFLFKGKDYNFSKVDNYFLIGKSDIEGLRSTELIQLENRTIETVLASIPKKISDGLEISEFIELNGLIVSGSRIKINELKNFLFQIDKVVPLVQIEVLIVQYQKSAEIQTGISAGLNDKKFDTSGVLFPTQDMTLNATSVNSLIDAFNGLGIINLGKVTENFYLNLKALENNSVINIKSTPKIATLSGHEASVSIGETSYYYEQSNRLINSGVNDNILQSGQWKSTEANLKVTIKPFVSTDDYVTLKINVEKSSFLARAGENAPPGKTTQTFDALIRVKNDEMVLLGGLDELERENSGTGTPFISKVPIIKWFFSSRKKKNEKSKLHIFVKPSIIY